MSLKATRLLPSYRKLHSATYIVMVETVLRQILPDSSKSPVAQEWVFPLALTADSSKAFSPPGLKFYGKETYMNTRTVVKPSTHRITVTNNVRKLRAFRALLDHSVFKDLRTEQQAAAGDILQEKLNEMFVEDCTLRLGNGWEKEHRDLAELTCYVPFRSEKRHWRGATNIFETTNMQASQLLERLDGFKEIDSVTLQQLRQALKNYLDESEDIASRAVNMTSGPMRQSTQKNIKTETGGA